MRVLVFGCGSMGRRHATTALALGCDVAVVDPAHDPELLVRELLSFTTFHGDRARQQKVVAFVNEADAWSWAPDAAVIATPAATHAELFWRAEARCQFIFCEKPLATSWDEMMHGGPVGLDTAGINARVQIGYNWRFHPLVCAFRKKMREVGRARAAVIWSLFDMRTWPGVGYADALLEGSHELDLALDLFGSAELGPVSPVKRDVLRDAWRVELHHAAGCRTIVTIVGLAPERVRGLRVLFDEYEGGYTVPVDDPRSDEALHVSYTRELRYFLDTVAGRTPPDYDGSPRPAMLEDGLAVLRLVDRVRALA